MYVTINYFFCVVCIFISFSYYINVLYYVTINYLAESVFLESSAKPSQGCLRCIPGLLCEKIQEPLTPFY